MSCASIWPWTTKNEVMRAQEVCPNRSELHMPELDNLILVENWPEKTVIRVTRDNFSERRKSFFIRHLAAEGYIPTDYASSPADGGSGDSGLQWIVDSSWPRTGPEPVRRGTPFMIRLLVYGFLLWLESMALLLLIAR